VKKDLFYANLVANRASSARRALTSTKPLVTVGGLSYTTAPYYYRLEAINGSRQSYSANIGTVGLRPTAPTALHITAGTTGTYLTWSSGAATGFTIARATNPQMTANRFVRSIDTRTRQYTPVGLAKGSTYYFQVRAVNNATPSGYSGRVSGIVRTSQQAIKVMTYNILTLSTDGTREVGGTISPWSKRGPAEAALIKQVSPDLIAIEEGGHWVGGTPGTRQVDSLRSSLAHIGLNYARARTETPYPERGAYAYGNYILYNPAKYQPVGSGWHWLIGDGHSAAYQELRNVATGARVLFVATHLSSPAGRNGDVLRENETKSLLAQAGTKAAALGVRVVYGGDFNSNSLSKAHPLDGPGVVMRSAHIADTRFVAQTHVNERYDSMNSYRRTPLTYGVDIDYVYASPGVAVSSWGTALRLSRGSFVGTIPSDHNPVYATVRIPY
jgi:endonuclease/exonuclease/phosphatase family metal-dependent hydrolase